MKKAMDPWLSLFGKRFVERGWRKSDQEFLSLKH